MATVLELVYRYRQIMGRCEAGAGMDFDEIDALAALEAALPMPPSIQASGWSSHQIPVVARTVLRGPRLDDEVDLINLGPVGCVCRRAPYAEEGTTVELVIQADADTVTYRFKASVTWLDDDEEDDFALGLRFVGVPVQMRYPVAPDAPPDDPGRAVAA